MKAPRRCKGSRDSVFYIYRNYQFSAFSARKDSLPTPRYCQCWKRLSRNVVRNEPLKLYAKRNKLKQTNKQKRLWDNTQNRLTTEQQKIDRQLVMSRNSSRIKASRKVQGRLLLSYKNPDFFSGLLELYRIFSKIDGVYVGWTVFFLFISFVCLYVAQKTTPARS